MLEWLQQIFTTTATTSSETTAEQVALQLKAFRERLGDEDLIRLWVEETSNLGNQSSSINLLYRLVRPATDLTYGYDGTVEVYYQAKETLEKIWQLLPELAGETEGPVDGATVKLIQWKKAPTDTVDLGLTGAADDNPDPGLAAMLACRYFLRLQPYLWRPERQQILFLDNSPAIDLNAQPALGGEAFGRRLFYVDPSLYATPRFSLYSGVKPAIIEYLTSSEVTDSKALQAIYSFKNSLIYFNSDPIYALALACGAALRWQGLPGSIFSGARPVVIVNFDIFEKLVGSEPDEVLDQVRVVLEGGLTPAEQARSQVPLPRTEQQNLSRRRQFFHSLGVADGERFQTLFEPQSVEAVRDAVNGLTGHKDRVLFIQLGHAPQPLFNHALYCSHLPPLFEGQNTTNAAINMGRPYLQLPRPSYSVEQRAALYPSRHLQAVNASEVAQSFVDVASQFNAASTVWPSLEDNAPVPVLASFYQQYTKEKPGDTIHKYFAALKAYFAAPDQDKLNLALAFLETRLQDERGLAVRRTAVLAGADGNPLDPLYAELEKQVTIGETLNLVPGVLTEGVIPQFFQALLKQYAPAFTLTVERFEHQGQPGAITEITLEGPTEVFASIGVSNRVTVVFTAPENRLTADVVFTAVGAWTLPQVPWIALRDPYLALRVPQGALPVNASIGGYYPAMESASPRIVARFDIPIYSQEPVWPARLDFAGGDALPGIATAFQMATSINLVALLPAPLNALVDLGVERVEVSYDFESSTLGALLIQARSNSKDLPLVGKVTLSETNVTAMVVQPTTKRTLALTASAVFRIGQGVVRVSTNYPQWQFSGSLESGVIRLEDVLSLFLPGVTLVPPSLPAITGFGFNYSAADDSLAVQMQLGIEWPFTFPGQSVPLFTIQSVGFAIARNRGINSGTIEGAVVLFGGEAAVTLAIGADYDGKSWTFRAKQTAGVFDIEKIVHTYLGKDFPVPPNLPQVKDLAVTLTTGTTATYELSAATAAPWQPIPGIDVAARRVKLKVGYGTPPANLVALAVQEATPLAVAAAPAYYGELEGELHLWSIDLSVFLKFQQGKQAQVCITWGPVTACLTTKDGDTVAEFKLAERTIGSLVAEFVSWVTGSAYALAAPFDLLNKVPLTNFVVTYNFTKKKVSFTVKVGPVDFGLFKLEGVSLAYNPEAKGTDADPKTVVTVDASFVWSNDPSLSWDPSKPEQTPAPSGGGNKYLDLRLAALGQHVTVAGLREQRRVQDAVALLRALAVPEPPEIPVGGTGQPVFAPESSWFAAFDFGVLKVGKEGDGSQALVRQGASAADLAAADDYFLQLSIVFNDPYLYALRIALAGPLAKVFAGLDFQILYRQVTDTVGVYSAEIALPSVMRRLQVGVATLTLPTFGIDVYTNGDFQVDIGFPWNEVFSRSFSIEAIVYPGIPVLGSGGFYFGKLSSATSDRVPAATNGWFNPVLVFGFGAQLGLGKSVEAGILRAGFSLTVFGIIEGVLARWLPYDGGAPNERKEDLQNGYYFALTGSVGALGKLYGSVDFSIVKADVDIELKLMLQITLAAYQNIPISVLAAVRVSLRVTVNLGLFKIKISLSFSASIKVTFVIDNPWGEPPWQVQAPVAARMLRRERRLSSARRSFALAAAPPYEPVWSNLQPPAEPLRAAGYVAPVLTVAGDEAKKPAEQQVCYAAGFFLRTPPPVLDLGVGETAVRSTAGGEGAAPGAVPRHRVAHAALERARAANRAANRAAQSRVAPAGAAAGAPEAEPASFEDLAVRVLQWVLAAGEAQPMTIDQVDALVIAESRLQDILAYLSDPERPAPVPVGPIEEFLAAQVRLRLDAPSEEGEGDAIFFPAPPGTRLVVPDFGGWKGFDYTFGGYNRTSDGYRRDLAAYFAQLRVQVQPPSVDGTHPLVARTADATDAGLSIASYVFSDYFTAIARQGVEALLAGLRSFHWVIEPAWTVGQIVDWVNETGQLGPDDELTPGDLFAGNPSHPLSVGRKLAVEGMRYQAPGGQSFTALAALALFGGAFDGRTLAAANAADARILRAGFEVVYGTARRRLQGGDSLDSVAAALGVSLDELLAGSNVLAAADLLQPLAVLAVPRFTHATRAGETLAAVAATYGLEVEGLAAGNRGVAGLFDATADPNLQVPHLPRFQVGALIDEARRTLALQHLGSMVSRFYLHGLRLPTALGAGGTEKVTALARGLFVREGAPGQYELPAQLGLFALTGQAFPLPDVPRPDGSEPVFAFTLTRGAQEGWLGFGAEHAASLEWRLDDVLDWQRYAAVRDYARARRLDTGMLELAPMAVAAVEPSRFPLSHEAPWQSAAPVVLPVRPDRPAVPRPRLWTLPAALVDLPHGAPGAPRPRLVPRIARYDEATGATVRDPVGNYGVGLLVPFRIKRVQPLAASPTTGRTYELMGAGSGDMVLLERLLDQLRDDDSSFQQMLLLFPPGQTGSEPKGWQSADPAATRFGITQVNLSTETRPPGGAAGRRSLKAEGAALGNVINGPTELLRLLWEASITRQGGFYLAYSDAADDAGLPERIFNDRGEATVAVLALFAAAAGGEGQPLANYMNVLATDANFDLGSAALVLETVRTAPPSVAPTTAGDTLEGLAERYYLDPATLAEANAGAALAKGTTVRVEGGLYQVPPISGAPTRENPGGNLALVAEHFGTTVQAIRDANPHRTAWPDPLPVYTALALPRLDVVVGTGPGGSGLGAFAAYYGLSVAALAATPANAGRAGLLAAGQTLAVALGPVRRCATLPPGVAGLRLVRQAPPEPPAEPGEAYARAYLQNLFNLLGYGIAENPDFQASGLGLPGGPADADGSGDDLPVGKLQAPRDPAQVERWVFERTAPYSASFAHPPKDGGPSPYVGVGGLLQFGLAWHDLFGNLILADLGSPEPAPGTILDRPPQLLGYVDDLLGLGQWPSVSAAFRVRPQDGKPVLDLVLDLDTGPYVDEAGDPDARLRRIRQAIQIYDRLLAQLTDPNGVELELWTSVTPGVASLLSPQDAAGLVAWLTAIRDWLRSLLPEAGGGLEPDPVRVITVPLDAGAVADGQVFEVTAAFTLGRRRHLVAGSLRSAAGVGSQRTVVAPYTGPLSSREASTPQAASWRRAAAVAESSAGESVQRGLAAFAAAFTAAFAALPGRSLRIATGSDRGQAGGAGRGTVWAVQLGTAKGEPISFTVDNSGLPKVFAPRPVSNQLRSGQAPIYDYVPGKGIDFEGEPSRTPTFTDVDLDRWMLQALAWIDALLTPRYVTPALVLRARLGTDLLAPLLEAKGELAGALRRTMIPVYKGETADDAELESVREVFRQRMLDLLGNFYTVKAGVQFRATVHAAIRPTPLATQPPRLYGDVTQLPPQRARQAGPAKDSNVSVSAPKLDLAFAEDGGAGQARLLSLLVATTSVLDKAIPLHLEYDARFVEHEIGELPGIDGYQPSSWLTFVDSELQSESAPKWPLSASLGEFPVPIVLREFPPTPTLVLQEAVAAGGPEPAQIDGSPGCNPLAAVTRWTYGFTYSQQVHREQDTIHGEIRFNVEMPGTFAAFAVQRSLFDDLAEMVTVYPQVLQDLDTKLSRIEFSTTDPQQLQDAAVALRSATRLTQRLAETASEAVEERALRAKVGGPPPLTFQVIEGEVPKKDPDGTDVKALLVTLTTVAGGAGLEAPFIDVDPVVWQRVTEAETADSRSFVYKHKTTGEWLTSAQGRLMAPRLLRLPGLDVLARQDAETAIHLTRNEKLTDRPSAEPFVYTTPTVRFSDPLLPTLTSRQPLDVATIGAVPPDCDPVRRSLTAHLEALYGTLFAESGVADNTLQLVVHYAHSVQPKLQRVSLPVFLMPPVLTAVAAGGTGKPLAEVIAAQVKGIETWFQAHTPSTAGARLQMSLAVMSNLTEQPMPLLLLDDLYLEVSRIQPPLGS